MRIDTLGLLRCPFCGTRLAVVENDALERTGDTLRSAVLGCACCAFPLVDGIPVLIADDRVRDAMHTLEAGHRREARHRLLGLDPARAAAFDELTSAGRPPTYRELLPVLSDDAEADYCLYRFSDPTYRSAESLIRLVAGRPRAAAPGPVLDLCGGSGHLTRVLHQRPGDGDTVLADLFYWKLWLAARITAPGGTPICCDANNPLPFVAGAFSTVILSDAFPYVWHKRLCAQEMARVATADGVIVMPHLHSALGENVSAGDTLTPAAYRDLFAPLDVRLFDDRRLLDDLLDRRIVDLTGNLPPATLGATPSVTLVASRDPAVFGRSEVADRLDVCGTLVVNPLYTIDYARGATRLTRSFPTGAYADEYRATTRYLPAQVTVQADLRGTLTIDQVGDDYAELRRRCVLLDLPRHYG